ncbi:MAG: TonB-dependent receptor [bacterium]|nr:TonB-dependent receptor [bacterium]
MALCRPLLGLAMIVFLLGMAPVESLLWPQDKESLLFEDIPVVITASRKEQPITEASTTISVITADDIRYSGAATIPDLLRQVAGIDVMTISARDQQVGIRGFMDPINNKLLVMVDGRSVYQDSNGFFLWSLLPVGLAEIQRIEIVKSPASSLYGANAYSGVINIITKTPEQLKGTTLQFTGGERETLIGSMIHAGHAAKEKISYKVSAEWNSENEWGEQEQDAGEILRMNALLEYKPGPGTKLAFSGGRSHSGALKVLFGETAGSSPLEATLEYVRFDFTWSDLKFRTFLKSDRQRIRDSITGIKQPFNDFSYVAEISHLLRIGKNHSLVWGGAYNFKSIKKNLFFPESHRQHLWSLFLEDEITVTDRVRLTLGGRYDRHPLAGGRFSPRGNLLYSPGANHYIRFSVAQAFRNPTFFDSYLDFEAQLKIIIGPPQQPLEVPYTYIGRGNQSIKPEGIIAYEIGYHGNWNKNLKFKLNLFYNRYTKLFNETTTITHYEQNELFPGSPGGVLPKTITASFENIGNARGIGGEMGLDFSISESISGFANYSFQRLTDTNDPSTPQGIEEDRDRTQYPKHKLNAGLRVLFKNGFSFNLLAHWMDGTQRRINDNLGNPYLAALDDYVLVNARLGATFWKDKAELALSVFNLFNDKHYQYPSDPNSLGPNSYRIGRKVTVTAKVKF